MSFEKRHPKPRPAGLRSDLSFNRRPLGGNRLGGNRLGGPSSRPSAPPRRHGGPPRRKGPPPQVRVPASPREKRDMLKAAAWRMSKIVHCVPAAIIAAEDPMKLIKVPDPRARALAKKVIRLKKTKPGAAAAGKPGAAT